MLCEAMDYKHWRGLSRETFPLLKRIEVEPSARNAPSGSC